MFGKNVQNHWNVSSCQQYLYFVHKQHCFLISRLLGEIKTDKTPENNPSQRHSTVTLTPLRDVILVNTPDSSQENHHYRKQCSEADGTDKNKAIPFQTVAALLNTYSLDRCRCPRHELFHLILSTEILAFHTLIESLALKGADAKRLTTL